jgi:transcriptional regulator with XRE-family HTH domain
MCLQLQELRKKDGVSLDLLSGLSDIDKSTLSKYERGILCPKFDTLKKWANVLGHQVTIELRPVFETMEG